ncbi:MAG TPA: signal peptidase I [Gemmatimonadaceae bacterium]|nr:signal peptidase I [Opitutus sp.]HVZ49755.1 signal peptidase I [Gemmatimonadaceae bacterium]
MATRKASGKEHGGKGGAGKGSVAALRSGKGGRASGGPRKLWEGFKSIAGTIAIFLILRTFFIEAYRIPSGSMIPSLLVGDWLFVNKLRYGPHVPFTNINIPGYAQPQRGDVVVFESPYQADEAEAGRDPTPILVKRLIGMPGDTIYMRDAVVYVDGIAQRLSETSADQARGDGTETSPLFDWQHKIELAHTRFGEPPREPTHDNWGPLLIPSGHYFMMGDNRYDSKDSRYWGIVPRRNVRGHPLFVYYSYVTSEYSDRPLSFITDIRWSRIGHWVR